MTPSIIQIIGAMLFAVAILHTFSTKFFERLAHTRPTHAGLWHLLGEVEVVFGFWAMILILCMFAVEGRAAATQYLDSRNFTEPMFVFAIMVIAGTKPILQFARFCVRTVAQFIPLPSSMAFYFAILALVPLLGSFITEPAAMTLAALILRDSYFSKGLSTRLRYTTLGVLFVNISIGGTLTPFAAPPVLMVAGKWGWDIWFMITALGWKAAIAVIVNALSATWLFRQELSRVSSGRDASEDNSVPAIMVALHLLFLVGVVAFAHHPAAFLGLFLFFLGVAHAYQDYQDRLILREGLLVAFFLAGLVVLGGQQQWWLRPVLLAMSSDAVFFGATFLTAITDNAALTYLGSLVEGLSDSFKYALVTGAVTGGGLTIIANAPNPAGVAILRGNFEDEAIHPMGLLVAAIPPTIVAILAFRLL
ncbi:putative Na+/H+ antiporter [Pseudogulbenkiania subflava]|uniref:Putative Na+/H+ antiporter n=1 Tax=Pseudogulbenkiania subflava DSM 22618 TaxID=1123014 RepID=A0A1Y6CCP1_9NEIS|nr:putative Na+/H+ antiporter [Pseudogulbenkiania subflava]SMF23334.1 Putative Na+/H+ antiporter [Pseudogulbenkiania subflava DSM 22618]SMF32703.1 Putative Na+/H+ antiporter [Pseudogulbenkiania subflava DSM 22618]SMF47734.1 Putative Na+/H+ antiporter [Pseudogulbenkiania subflava DSM 22618]